MKRLITHINFVVLSLIFLASCTERMDIKLPAGQEKLVVEAYLFPGDSSSQVQLTKSANYFSNEAPTPVSNASIQLDDGENTWYFQPSAKSEGHYFLSQQQFHPVTGKKYHLDIQLSKPIGNETHFESNTILPPLRVHIDSLGIEYAPVIEKWIVRIFARDSVGKDFYLFNSRVNGKCVTDSIPRKVVRSDEFFDGRYLNGAVVQVLNKDELHPGDYYTLKASNITEAYYHYLIELQDEVETKNPLFSGPSSNVQGNISGGALGFFTAFASTSFQVILQHPKKQTAKCLPN